MSDLSELKERYKSAVQTKKITDAMYMISVATLKRSLHASQCASAAYSAVYKALSDVMLYGGGRKETRKYCEKDRKGEMIYAVIMSDRGLCGPYNNDIASFTAEILKEQSGSAQILCFGTKGKDALRAKNIDPDRVEKLDTFRPFEKTALYIGQILRTLYDDCAASGISVIYYDHETRSPECAGIFPIEPDTSQPVPEKMYFEPSFKDALENIVSAYVFASLQTIITSAVASESAKRIEAMQNAGKNADEMISSLEISMNLLRQSMITNEITETAAAAEIQNGC